MDYPYSGILLYNLTFNGTSHFLHTVVIKANCIQRVTISRVMSHNILGISVVCDNKIFPCNVHFEL